MACCILPIELDRAQICITRSKSLSTSLHNFVFYKNLPFLLYVTLTTHMYNDRLALTNMVQAHSHHKPDFTWLQNYGISRHFCLISTNCSMAARNPAGKYFDLKSFYTKDIKRCDLLNIKFLSGLSHRIRLTVLVDE